MRQPKRKKQLKGRLRPSLRHSVPSPNKIVFHIDDEWINAKEAAKIAGVAIPTIYMWCTKYGIGKKTDTFFKIFPERLKKFLEHKERTFRNDRHVQNKCPHGYHFGVDYDEKEKCTRCNQVVWLHCGRRNEKIYFTKQALNKSNKLYTEKELEKKIKEMEERI